MNERLKLNDEPVRAWLGKEDRKLSYLAKQLDVSGSLVEKMLNEGHIPKKRTLKKLAALLGVKESDLLLPKEEAA